MRYAGRRDKPSVAKPETPYGGRLGYRSMEDLFSIGSRVSLFCSVKGAMIGFKKRLKERVILVIEDDEDFSESLCKMLARRGYGVARAATGRDGLDQFKERPADLVITDILLPDCDGLHVILDLKKILPGVKIIAISGGGQLATGEEYLQDIKLLCDIEHTLAKPFQSKQLFSLIRKVLH